LRSPRHIERRSNDHQTYQARRSAALEAFPDWASKHKHAERLQRHQAGEAVYLIAWCDAQPVGHVLLKWNGATEEHVASRMSLRCPDIEDLFVLDAQRNQGYGARLIHAAEELVRARVHALIGLSVGIDNINAKRLYERLGYSDAGFGVYVEQGKYVDSDGQTQTWHETCIYMTKTLEAPADALDDLLCQKLTAALQQQLADFPGVAGIAVQSLRRGWKIAINDDEIFPTASTIKIHILTQLLARAAAGEIDLHQRITPAPEQCVSGSGVLAYLDDPVELTLLNLAILMIIASDNTATNLCIDLAGMEATNALLRQLGLSQTTLRRKMIDHAAAVRDQENVSTPNELVAILAALYSGQPTPAVAAQCLAILKKPTHGFLDRALPPDLLFANKPGFVERACCDAGIVYLPRHPYIVAIMTKFALCDKEEQQRHVVDCLRTVHATMAVLDTSNKYGRSL
jgi:beta-lactamase class A